MFKLLCLLLALLFTIGCGDASSRTVKLRGGGNGQLKPGDPTTFYKSLDYKKVSDGGRPKYRYLRTNLVTLKPTEKKNKVYIQLDLFLNVENKPEPSEFLVAVQNFVLVYREHLACNPRGEIPQIFHKIFRGTFTIESGLLKLKGVGIAKAATGYVLPLSLTTDIDFNQAGSKGKTYNFQMETSELSMDSHIGDSKSTVTEIEAEHILANDDSCT